MTHYINKDFLLREGWVLKEEKPLYCMFDHPRDQRINCSLGSYGEFSIVEYDWCNHDEIVRTFATINPKLTQEDYKTILRLTCIDAPKCVTKENTKPPTAH
jgi:hypothetical protein